MKKMITIFALVAFSMVSMTTLSQATSKSHLKKGQRIFKKKLRRYCRFSGVRFARKHTQDEWEEIWDDGNFKKETKKICPRLNLRRIRKNGGNIYMSLLMNMVEVALMYHTVKIEYKD